MIITFSCILFFGRIFFGFFKRLSPFHKYSGSSCQINTSQLENNISVISDATQTDNNFNETESPQIDQPTSSNSEIIDQLNKKKKRKLFSKLNKHKYDFQSVSRIANI